MTTESHPECAHCEERKLRDQQRRDAMDSKWVRQCVMVAECLNRLRIIPRIIVAGYGYLCWIVINWFMSLPDPGTQQAALVTTIVGAAGIIFGFYMQGGITGGGGSKGSYGTPPKK